jgi:hypothetical protein
MNLIHVLYFMSPCIVLRRRENSECIEPGTGWTPEVQFPVGSRDFLYSTPYGPALGSTQPPTRSVSGDSSQGIKPLGREADH